MAMPDDAEDPESPSASDAPEDLESPSSDPQADADATEESPSDDATAEAGSDDDPEEKALAKHGGDRKKFAKHYWETQKQNATFLKETTQAKREADEAKRELQALKAKEKPPAEQPLPPQLQGIANEISSLTEELRAIPAQAEKVAQAYYAATDRVAELKALLKTADDLDRPAVQERLENALLAQEAKADKHEALRDKYAQKAQRLRERQELLTSERDRQQQSTAARERYKADFRQEVADLATEAADDLGISKNPGTRAYLKDLVTAHLGLLFSRQHYHPVSASEIDYEGEVQAFVQRFAKEHGLSAKTAFTKASEDKLKVAKPVAKPPARPAPPRSQSTSTLSQFEANRQAVLARARKRAAAAGL